jgi:hypothetical protein
MRSDRSELNTAKHWRHRAEKARAHAEQISDRKVKHTLLGFADGYEKIAKRIEKLAAKSAPRLE